MFSIHSLQLEAPVERVVQTRVPGNACFIVIRSEYACVPRFVQYAFLQAYKSYVAGAGVAKSLSLEWLCKLALSKNVSSAVNFTKPVESAACLASVNCFENGEWKKFSTPIKVEKRYFKAFEKTLIDKYCISEKALSVYSLEDLLIESAAVENIC